MFKAQGYTICPNCNRLVHAAPGNCFLCGESFQVRVPKSMPTDPANELYAALYEAELSEFMGETEFLPLAA